MGFKQSTDGIAEWRFLRHVGVMRWIVLILWGLAPLASASLQDILKIDESKANNMADLKFDTKKFQAREFEGVREFKTERLNPNKEFRTNRMFDPGGRAIGTPVAEVFTGTSRLRGDATMFSRSSSLGEKRVELPGRAPFTREANPMGERRFAEADRRYEGPELKRRTTEIEIINQALKTKEEAEGRVLSMEEVRAVLNRFE
jgi:hypothetical protein